MRGRRVGWGGVGWDNNVLAAAFLPLTHLWPHSTWHRLQMRGRRVGWGGVGWGGVGWDNNVLAAAFLPLTHLWPHSTWHRLQMRGRRVGWGGVGWDNNVLAAVFLPLTHLRPHSTWHRLRHVSRWHSQDDASKKTEMHTASLLNHAILVSRCPWFRNHPWFQNHFFLFQNHSWLQNHRFWFQNHPVLVADSSLVSESFLSRIPVPGGNQVVKDANKIYQISAWDALCGYRYSVSHSCLHVSGLWFVTLVVSLLFFLLSPYILPWLYLSPHYLVGWRPASSGLVALACCGLFILST